VVNQNSSYTAVVCTASESNCRDGLQGGGDWW